MQETVFTAVLQFLAEDNYVQLMHYFVDSTKIEANANRYTFVWGKKKDRIRIGIFPNWASLSTITSEKLEHAVKQLRERLQEKPNGKPLKKAVRILRKDLLPRMKRF